MIIDLQHLTDEELTQKKMECLNKFPKHKLYDVIYADPPWRFNRSHETLANNVSKQYPTMSVKQLTQLPVKDITAKDCALFMWVCNPLLNEALKVMESWGFTFKTVFKVWKKRTKDGTRPTFGAGWWSRGSVELLLVGSKGAPLKNKTTNSMKQEFASPRKKHSEKPDEIRDDVKNFLSVDRRLELFGRKSVDDWDVWGLECPHFFAENGSVSTPSQCSNVETPIKKSKRGGVSHHKKDCSCCVCKCKKAYEERKVLLDIYGNNF